MKIPTEVQEALSGLLTGYQNHISYLGKKREVEYYMLNLDELAETGYPIVCSYDNKIAKVIEGPESLNVLRLFK